jgi:phosphoglycerate dehydrogenase-like enzyme
MTDTELEQVFRQWWKKSYPTGPSEYTLMSMLAWSRHLLNQTEQQNREVNR